MVDKQSLQRRLALLRNALADLRRYRAKFDEQAIVTDRDVQHMVVHALYVPRNPPSTSLCTRRRTRSRSAQGAISGPSNGSGPWV